MTKYQFTQTYKSNLTSGTKGETVEITDELAALVNNDSPGTLEACDDDAETRAVEKPSSDRMVHTAKKRTDRELAEPIDKSTFKAVKDK